MNPQSIIAIIPARGGSVRLPRKNLLPINGTPLVGLAIKQALASSYIQRVIVSTEDDEIASVSRRYGAEVIKRPTALAQGETGSVLRVINHALAHLEKYEGKKPLVVVLLQPTSPCRIVEDIDQTIKLLLDTGSESAETMCGGKENGAVYVSRREVHTVQNKVTSERCVYYEMPLERSIDIDTLEDYERARATLEGAAPAPPKQVHKGWPKGVKRSKK